MDTAREAIRNRLVRLKNGRQAGGIELRRSNDGSAAELGTVHDHVTDLSEQYGNMFFSPLAYVILSSVKRWQTNEPILDVQRGREHNSVGRP